MAGGLNSLGNLLCKTNASNALVVTLDGGTASATKFLAGDGTVSAPAYSFTSEPNTGVYHSGVDATSVFRVAVNGTAALAIDTGPAVYVGAGGVVFGTTLGAANPAQMSCTAANQLTIATGDSLNLVSGGLGVGVVNTTAGTIASGMVRSSSRVLQTRTDTAVSTDGNVTYTAAQVLAGWITRTNMGSNRTDAFPTAADLVAGIPGAAVGHSFTLVVNNNDTAQTLTVNGASNGITYEGTATAIAAAEARLFLCILTNVTGAAEAATVIQVV